MQERGQTTEILKENPPHSPKLDSFFFFACSGRRNLFLWRLGTFHMHLCIKPRPRSQHLLSQLWACFGASFCHGPSKCFQIPLRAVSSFCVCVHLLATIPFAFLLALLALRSATVAPAQSRPLLLCVRTILSFGSQDMNGRYDKKNNQMIKLLSSPNAFQRSVMALHGPS
jgi:hypothetical protein